MTVAEIEAAIAELQAKLAILNTVPPDTFPIGTVVVFDASGTKWYRVKVGEEIWKNTSTSNEHSLAEWILEAKESGVIYFEVYVMITEATPFYASA